MKIPIWDDLIEEQIDVLDHPLNKSLFVAGPPGSGKTVLAIFRARMVSENSSSVAIITFNRMLRRLISILNTQSTSKTMHSFVYNDYYERTGLRPPKSQGADFSHDWADILFTLKKTNTATKFQHIVVDEGQDLQKDFFQYISIHPDQILSVFADEDQALTPNRTTLKEIRESAKLPFAKILSHNHRNSPEISFCAEHFHSGILPAAEVLRDETGVLPKLKKVQNNNETVDFISTWFANRGGSIGIIVDTSEVGIEIYEKMKIKHPNKRIDRYDGENEMSIEILKDGITILNHRSSKGQEFETVFIVELERLIPCTNDTKKRIMYMLCTRARSNLFLIYGPKALSREAEGSLPDITILER